MLEVPVWLTHDGRPTFERPKSLAEIRAMATSPSEAVATISSGNWQQEYVERMRRRVLDFLAFVADDVETTRLISEQNNGQPVAQKMMQQFIGRLLALYGGHLLITRHRIGAATTLRQYLLEAAGPWPGAFASRPVTEFLSGLELVVPVLPMARDGAHQQQSMDDEAIDSGFIRLVESGEVLMMALSAGVRAGLRMRETARILMRRPVVIEDDGTVAFEEKAEGRMNMRGRKLTALRTTRLPIRCVPAWRTMTMPWTMNEATMTELVRRTASGR